MKPPFKRDLAQVGKAWLKGRLTEAVVDADGEVLCITAESAEAADFIVHRANAYPKLIAALRDALQAYDMSVKRETSTRATRIAALLLELGEG